MIGRFEGWLDWGGGWGWDEEVGVEILTALQSEAEFTWCLLDEPFLMADIRHVNTLSGPIAVRIMWLRSGVCVTCSSVINRRVHRSFTEVGHLRIWYRTWVFNLVPSSVPCVIIPLIVFSHNVLWFCSQVFASIEQFANLPIISVYLQLTIVIKNVITVLSFSEIALS